ncbi:hypothetical protein BDZ85DRAFT_256196 [Elsinoe ampelina]|uniref:Uncharacterized protein n=1 Tax=Elsinoe ampelina TaxID=302913 RepID=A0A6A6GLE3_9PEZI|nr:hypothetical protein BDZ85DRAFT_256196 [Elsinoe ampelina]
MPHASISYGGSLKALFVALLRFVLVYLVFLVISKISSYLEKMIVSEDYLELGTSCSGCHALSFPTGVNEVCAPYVVEDAIHRPPSILVCLFFQRLYFILRSW